MNRLGVDRPGEVWLVWRRQRAALLVALGVAAALASVLAVGRWWTLATADELGLAGCLPAAARACTESPWNEFRAGFSSFYHLTRIALVVAPAVLGIIAGAGLFSRELERGTHVFTLTQSTGRLRWWAFGLLVSGIPVAVAAVLLTAVARPRRGRAGGGGAGVENARALTGRRRPHGGSIWDLAPCTGHGRLQLPAPVAPLQFRRRPADPAPADAVVAVVTCPTAATHSPTATGSPSGCSSRERRTCPRSAAPTAPVSPQNGHRRPVSRRKGQAVGNRPGATRANTA